MPVNGLPCAVEGALNNLMSTSHVSSWRIQGNGKVTILTVKFCENEGVMADPYKIHYRKKPPSSIKRDKERSEEYFTEKDRKEQKQIDDDLTETTSGTERNMPTELLQTSKEFGFDNGKGEKMQNIVITKENNKTANKETTHLPKTKRYTVQECDMRQSKDSTPSTVVNSKASETSHPVTQTETTQTFSDKTGECKITKQNKDFIPSKNRNKAEEKLQKRNYHAVCITSQLDRMSRRMMYLFVSPTRNNMFIHSGTTVNDATNKEEIIVETDDFMIKIQPADPTNKSFMVKNTLMYQSSEEERWLAAARTGPDIIDKPPFKEHHDNLEQDLLLLKDFINLYLSLYDL